MATTPRRSPATTTSPRDARSSSRRSSSGRTRGSGESPAQSVRTRLPGAGAAPRFKPGEDASGVSTRRVSLMYDVVSVSHEAATARAINLLNYTDTKPGHKAPRRARHWSATRNSGVTMILGLRERCLLSSIVIENKTISSLSVEIATENTPRHFIRVDSMTKCPHGKVVEVKTGHIPCTFVKVSFHSGTPIAAYSLRLVGMPVPTVLPLLGPTLDTLLVQQTGDTLFGSSLHASLPASYQEYLRERLPAPQVHLEVDDYDTAPTLLDLVLRKNKLVLER